MEGIHVGFDRRICTDASSKPLPIATYCLRLAQIRRAKLRCTCHGAIFERVLVRRTQEYKSIPRTTSRKSPEIAHVRRHGSLPCMPLFSPRAPLSFSRYVFIERKRIYYKIGNMLLRRKRRIFHRVEKALFWRKSGFITERKGADSEKSGFITELKRR